MQIGIFGLTNSGKTTIFNALTGSHAEVASYSTGMIAPNVGTVKVPDPRVDKLSEIYQPKKTTPAEVTYTDVPGLAKGMGSGSDQQAQTQLFTHLRQSQALLHVVRAFEDENVAHPDDSINPARDIETAEFEFIMADLGVIEKRLERLTREVKKLSGPQKDQLKAEEALLLHFKASLEDEKPIRMLDITEAEEKMVRGFQFLSQKPQLILLNIDENDLPRQAEMLAELQAHYQRPQTHFTTICGKVEMELAQMDPEDALVFMEDLAISEPGLNKAIRLSYELLGLQSFFTVGQDEVRAWTIRKGTNAQRAAGEIHSDLERGFIRAEVLHYDEHIKFGTFAEARKNGAVRLEGKGYLVHDGDIMNIRFNV